MTFRHSICIKILRLYRIINKWILSFIEKYKLSSKQIDYLAAKLDIWGAATVAQALVWQTKSAWLNYSLIVCAILWLIAFIVKGAEK